MSLDIMALTQYNGQGMCSNVDCCYETARRNREEVRSWAIGECIGSDILFLNFLYDSEVRLILDYPFLKELEFLCIKNLRIFA